MRLFQLNHIAKCVAVVFALVFVSGCVTTQQDGPVPVSIKNKKKNKGVAARERARLLVHKSLPKRRKHRYFVEFRSRPNGVTSHSYLAYGRLYSRGRTRNVKLVGLHPKNGSAGFLIGSFVGMEAQLKPTWADKNVPHTISFRAPLTKKQYRKVVAFINAEKKKKHVWNLVLNNCNGFVGQVAELVGLEKPGASAVPPSSYVQSLIDLNT